MSGFGCFDETGDGLCLTEFVKYLKGTYGVTISEASARCVFNDIDSRRSDDDRITWEEWTEFLNSKSFDEVQKDDLIKLFESCDCDGSGTLCFKELLPRLHDKGYNEAEVKQILDDLDTNDDQVISKCEWMKIADKIIQQKK